MSSKSGLKSAQYALRTASLEPRDILSAYVRNTKIAASMESLVSSFVWAFLACNSSGDKGRSLPEDWPASVIGKKEMKTMKSIRI